MKKLYFSNVSFLTSVKSQSNSKNTLRKLLVLFMRILAIVFLVLAFAQPIEERATGTSDNNHAAYYLDNSLSMGRRSVSNNDLLTDGLLLMKGLTVDQPANVAFSFFTNDLEQYNRPVYNRELEDELSEVALTNRVVSVDQVMAKANRLDGSVKDLFILSDFQKNTFGQFLSIIDNDSVTNYHLLKFESETSGNLYIDSVLLDNPIGLPGKNRLGILVKCIGGKRREDILIKIYKDNNQVASFTESFTANSSTWVEIDLSQAGTLNGEYTVTIDDGEFTYDNQYYFVIDSFKKSKVYQVYDQQPSTYVKNVYSNPEYFELKLSSIKNLSQDELLGADLIVFDHLPELPDWLSNQLASFENSMLILPEKSLDRDSYSRFINKPISISSDSSSYEVDEASLDHPFFVSVFNRKDKETNLPWMKSTLSFDASNDVILKSRLGKPLLSQIRSNLYLLASPLEDEFTNLHKHGLFLPLMYKLSLAHRVSPVLSYTIGDQMISIDNDSLVFSGALRFESKNGVIVPSLRTGNGELALEIPSVLNKPGFYHLMNGEDKLASFAFNLSSKESDIVSLTDEEIQQWIVGRENVTFDEISDVMDYSQQLASASEGLPLWKYALLLALIFLIAELTLLRIFR